MGYLMKSTSLLTYEQAGKVTGLPASYLRNRVKNGTGPAYLRISPRVTRFTREDLDDWMARITVHTTRGVTGAQQ
jgi:excisionase family DNA binding protein